jgi:sarcosine oxidase subunit alpha
VTRAVDVLVIGAGAAGCAAALEARRAGADTVLVDEFGVAGGTLAWSIVPQSELAENLTGMRGFEVADALSAQLALAGLELTHGVAWGVFEDKLVGIAGAAFATQLRAGSIIVATGSTDIVAPFPGWELPGVMTARAALRCLHAWRVWPGERVAVVGVGDAATEVADAFAIAGAPVLLQGAAVSVGGIGRVEWAEIDGTRAEVDCVVITHGRQPDSELAQQALCEVGFSQLDQAFVPLRDAQLATSVAGLYVVGDAAGSCTTAEALAEGRLAGRAACGLQTENAARALAALRSAERAAEVARLRPSALTEA